jgi:hypothetical protein
MSELLSTAVVADAAVVAVLFAIFILYAVWQDMGALIVTAIALPVAAFLFGAFPYTESIAEWFPESLRDFTPLALFIVFLLLCVWIVRRTVGTGVGGKRALHVLAVSAALTAMVIAFTYHVVSVAPIYDFSPMFDSIFGSTTYFFWIIALALLALFVV